MVNKLKILTLVKILTLLFVVPALMGAWPSSSSYGGRCIGTTYYVSSSGSNSNCGNSISRPWQTIAKVNSFIFPQGATVSFAGGQTFSASVSLTATNSPSGTLTINSYGVGSATISSGNSAACISALNISAVTVNNIICTGGGDTTNTTDGIHIENNQNTVALSGPTITNTTISGYGGNCVWVDYSGTGSFGFDGTTISNNTMHDCTGKNNTVDTACILLGSVTNGTALTLYNNPVISGNTIFNCIGTSSVSPVGTGSGIFISSSTGTIIQNNLVHDTGASNSGGNGPVGIILVTSSDGLVQFNESYNNSSTSGEDGEGIDFDIGVIRSVMQYNYLHDNQTADIIVGDFGGSAKNDHNTIRFNITQNGSKHENGIHIHNSGTGTTNLAIFNNTIVLATSISAGFGCISSENAGGLSVVIANNICYGVGAINATMNLQSGSGNSVKLTGNDYFSDAGTAPNVSVDGGSTFKTSLAALQTAGFEKVGATNVGTTANPTLTGPSFTAPATVCGGYAPPCPAAYKLQNSSSLIEPAGLNLCNIYGFQIGTQDFYGNAEFPDQLPIGAHIGVVPSPSHTACYVGPGDVVPGALVWWSCDRSYNAAYAVPGTNAGCNIRRSSDSHTCDVLIAASGTWANTANCSNGGDNGQSAASFCNATSCFVVTAYDQSGALACSSAACNATQSTAADQPSLAFNCIGSFACLTPNGGVNGGLVSASIGGSQRQQPFTFAQVSQSVFSSAIKASSWNDGTNSPGNGFDANTTTFAPNTVWSFAGICCAFATAADSVWHAVTHLFNTTQSSIMVDGVNTTGQSLGTGTIASTFAVFGGKSNSSSSGDVPTDKMIEQGHWLSAFGTKDQINLCKNEQAYYGAGNFGAAC